eukprot:3617673-Pyramimonas_sp.AAC.1
MRPVWDPTQSPYGHHGIPLISHTACMRTDATHIRPVWDPKQVPCGLYEIPYRAQTACMGSR